MRLLLTEETFDIAIDVYISKDFGLYSIDRLKGFCLCGLR